MVRGSAIRRDQYRLEILQRGIQPDDGSVQQAVVAILDDRSFVPWDNIVWGLQSRIDPSAPRVLALWQLEFLRFPMRVESEVDHKVLLFELPAECDGIGSVAPIGAIRLQPMPSLRGTAQHFREPDPTLFVSDVTGCALLAQQSREPKNIFVSNEIGPVEPADVIVLAIGVVVAALRSSDFVPHEDHRHAEGE